MRGTIRSQRLPCGTTHSKRLPSILKDHSLPSLLRDQSLLVVYNQSPSGRLQKRVLSA